MPTRYSKTKKKNKNKTNKSRKIQKGGDNSLPIKTIVGNVIKNVKSTMTNSSTNVQGLLDGITKI
jgi:hypothetical protein